MNLSQELQRKALHLFLIIIPFAYLIFGKWLSVLIIAIIAMPVVSLDYWRSRSAKINAIFVKIFNPILREHEKDGKKLCGASWVAMGACVNFAIFKPEIAITGFLILVISDALAAVIGKRFPSEPFFEKSVSGSAAFFISGLIILISCGIYFNVVIGFFIFGLFALVCTTLLEARPSLFEIDDNFLIPVAFSLITSFFDVIWYYSW